MMRRYTSVILILCLVSSMCSCYTTKKTQYAEVPPVLPPYDTVLVHTKDGQSQVFVNCIVSGDHVIGTEKAGRTTSIDRADILYVEVQKRELSTGWTIVAILGGAVIGTVLLAAIIIAVASCPHVSSFDGQSWVLEAEPNGGAITRTTEYTDFSVLKHLRALPDSVYRLRFQTTQDEIDFTNEVKLLAVDHAPDVEVLPDVRGRLLALSGVRHPRSALTDGGVDLARPLNEGEELFWDGDPQRKGYDKDHPRDEITLTFERPEGCSRGVLVFEGSSTFWSTYVMADFLSKYGRSAAARFKRLESDPNGREKVDRFMEKSGYHMEVLLKSDGEWTRAGYFRTAGTYVSKVQALEIDLPKNASETVELKLRYTPFFWNIRDIGMSFSFSDKNLLVSELAPLEARDLRKGDIRDLLLARDDSYYRSERGDCAEMSFAVPRAAKDRERTLILKSSGYYNFVLEKDKELPFFAKAWRAVKKQGIDGYSLERFQALEKQASR